MFEPTAQTGRAAGASRSAGLANQVAVVKLPKAVYPCRAPYNPSVAYPEYPFGREIAKEPNHVYEGVRQLLYDLGLDRGAFGSPTWNPLKQTIEPGMRVVIKPNFVLSRHAEGKDLYSIITHPSVLRAVADYCWIALKGQGKILIADAPQYNCNYAELLQQTHLDEVCDFYSPFGGPDVAYRDLRRYWSAKRHFGSMTRPLPGDPEGVVRIDLGQTSAFRGKSNADRLYGAVYHRSETVSCHSGGKHVYEISATILNADVVIMVPKLKVHKKVGVTLNAKGLVGIATNKNLIVHYTLGSPKEGGDQYPDGLLTPVEESLIKIERWMYDHFLAPRSTPLELLHRFIYWCHNNTTRRLGLKVSERKRLVDAGNWYGNDSAWRMTIDLLRIFYFADSKGQMHKTPQRRMFSVVDGVIGGEGCGPLTPDPKESACLLAGENPLAVDLVATRLMGFDPMSLKIYSQALGNEEYDFGFRRPDEIAVLSGDPSVSRCLGDLKSKFLDFKPHPGWIGHIEVQEIAQGATK